MSVPIEKPEMPTSGDFMLLLSGVVGHTALNRSLRRFTVTQGSAVTLFEPVIAGALAWLALNERVTLAQGAGAILVLGGVAVTMLWPSSELKTQSDLDNTLESNL